MNSVEWLETLISFDTTSRHSNMGLVRAIQAQLAPYSALSTRVTYDTSKEKANLFITIPAADGNFKKNGLILSGHMDVVPVDGQAWATDPFKAVVTADRVYGRGACDMKGFIAVVLALVPHFLQQSLKNPLHFAFTYDEEVGGLGVPGLIADFQQAGFQPAACIVGEPTDMHIVVAHKGISTFRCRIKGRAAHSSLTPQGCNAIEHAAQFITWIRGLAEQFKQQGPFDDAYDVSFSTITTNKIQGGTALNIIPDGCEFAFELRHLPEVSVTNVVAQIQNYAKEVLLPQMKKEFSDAMIEIVPICGVPEFASTADFTKLAEVLQEHTKKQQKVSYATEAGFFQQAGIPTLICGPGNIAQAHRADEFILLEQMRLCERVLGAIGK